MSSQLLGSSAPLQDGTGLRGFCSSVLKEFCSSSVPKEFCCSSVLKEFCCSSVLQEFCYLSVLKGFCSSVLKEFFLFKRNFAACSLSGAR